MSESEWVEDDYPTAAALERIEKWPYEDIAGCLDFVMEVWHWPDFGVSNTLRPEEAAVCHAEEDDGERYLRLATGGWSGNESIIRAMNSNYMLRAFSWRLSSRGGLHIYQYPSWQRRKEPQADPAGATSPAEGAPASAPTFSSLSGETPTP